ncbi:hypothetical protein Nizo3892_2304 [Lactiplantibacillus plantarum]|nr:hypothetical protein Nizo3892_2304 [Lactiplantibacillus plantarum]
MFVLTWYTWYTWTIVDITTFQSGLTWFITRYNVVHLVKIV